MERDGGKLMPVVDRGTPRPYKQYKTEESLGVVLDFLANEDIIYTLPEKGNFIDIYSISGYSTFKRYWYSTGKWIPDNHLLTKYYRAYHSKGIKDFINRFVRGN